MTSAILIDHISKSYGQTQALQDIQLDIQAGERFGLIGPDGAGKTSLIRILATLLLADKGSASMMGKDIVKDYLFIRRNIGYMPGKFSLYYDLTIEENLSLFATIFGTSIEQNYDLIKDVYVQIEPFKKRKAGQLSGGMKQKLALSCALIHRPKILLLDEPTTGVDAVSRREFWDMLQGLGDHGITILVSTPYMDEASRCERVGLIQGGKIMQVDSPENITRSFQNKLFAVRSDDTYRLLQELRAHTFTYSVHAFGDHLHYVDKQGDRFRPEELKQLLESRGHKAVKIEPIAANIEDCFMELMQS